MEKIIQQPWNHNSSENLQRLGAGRVGSALPKSPVPRELPLFGPAGSWGNHVENNQWQLFNTAGPWGGDTSWDNRRLTEKF